jgi:hypothetical protein
VYVNGVKINGEQYDKLYFPQDLFEDGTLFEFDMGAAPSGWAAAAEAPPSLTEGDGADYQPEILMDIIPMGVSIAAELPQAAAETKQAVLSGVASNGANLFDNNSTTTETIFTGSAGTITYYSPTPAKVEMYTLTSSNTSGADPKAWTLSGSNDGAEWTELDSRSLDNLTTYVNTAVTTAANAATKETETFRWRRQTKPFAIDAAKQGLYKYYRLNITASSSEAAMRLSQFELLADEYYEIDQASLLSAINSVDAIIEAQESGPVYGAAEYDALLAELAAARAVYDDEGATGMEINVAISKLGAAKAALLPIRKAYEPFGAVTYNYSYNRPGAVDGIKTESTGNCTGAVTGTVQNVAGSTPGAIIGYKYMDFGDGGRLYTSASAIYAGVVGESGCDGAHMLVRLDAPDGPVIADIDTPPSGSAWTLYQKGYGDILTPGITGVHDVYIELQSSARHVANIYQFAFEFEAQTEPFALVQTSSLSDETGVLTVSAALLNGSDAGFAAKAILAAYAPEGQLLGAFSAEEDVPANAKASFAPFEIDVSGYPEGYSVKLFAWRADGYAPIAPAAIVR